MRTLLLQRFKIMVHSKISVCEEQKKLSVTETPSINMFIPTPYISNPQVYLTDKVSIYNTSPLLFALCTALQCVCTPGQVIECY